MICCISMAIVSLKRATNYIIRGLVRREENKERMASLFGRRRERAAAARESERRRGFTGTLVYMPGQRGRGGGARRQRPVYGREGK